MSSLETRRIWIYLTVAFGFTWTLDLIVYLTGGLTNSPTLVAGTPINLAFVLILLSMWGPALGHVAARVVTGEGWADTGLRPNLRRGWVYWLLMWVLPAIFAFLGADSVGVKAGATREVADEWLDRYPRAASVMRYIGRSGWNSLEYAGIPDDELLEAVDESYRLVVSKLPAKHRPVGWDD